MGDIVNLRSVRKRMQRDADQRRAAENRVRHGRTRGEKQAEREERRKADAAVEAHRREGCEDRGPHADGEEGAER